MRTLKLYKQNGPVEPTALGAELAAAMPVDLPMSSMGTSSKRNAENPEGGFATVDVDYADGRSMTEEETAAIQAALDAHAGEALLARLGKLVQALQWSREQLVNTVWGNMSSGERKLVLGLALTAGEEDEIVAEWEAK